jgi:hypothetical protein
MHLSYLWKIDTRVLFMTFDQYKFCPLISLHVFFESWILAAVY